LDNSIKITGIIVGAVLILAILAGTFYMRVSPSETVTADGSGSIIVIPDQVSIHFNVETKGASAKEAKDANSLIVEKVRNDLILEGFSEEEVQTQNFNVYEDFEYKNRARTSVGYKATHSLVVKFSTNDQDKIGEAIDAGIDAGANLGWINFELSPELQGEKKAEALTLATQDAKVKAEAIAEGLNADLGRVVSTSTSDFGYQPWRMYDYGTVDAEAISGESIETSIQTAERHVTAQVSVTYKLN